MKIDVWALTMSGGLHALVMGHGQWTANTELTLDCCNPVSQTGPCCFLTDLPTPTEPRGITFGNVRGDIQCKSSWRSSTHRQSPTFYRIKVQSHTAREKSVVRSQEKASPRSGPSCVEAAVLRLLSFTLFRLMNLWMQQIICISGTLFWLIL